MNWEDIKFSFVYKFKKYSLNINISIFLKKNNISKHKKW